MIVPDVNLLVYAYNSGSRYHAAAAEWLRSSFSGQEPVGIPWAAAFGFIRLLSNPSVVMNPDRPEDLAAVVRTWFALPAVRALTPGMDHLKIVERLFRDSGANGRLTTDVHLAAIALELGATLYSNDSDFSRFDGLDWVNPLR